MSTAEQTIEKAHADDYFAQRFAPHEFRDGRCSYCGSMTVEGAIEALTTPGTRYSGSDWKYGWPHKFYLGDRGKFYSTHLRDATPEQLERFNAAAANTVGVLFDIREEDGALGYRAPHHGFQTWGVVSGATPEPR